MARAFSYLRFSRPEQRKGDSLRRQTEAAQAYAEKHDLLLDTSSFRDLGISAYRGAHAEIGGLKQFINAIEDGHVRSGDYLLIENLDRLSRQNVNTAYQLLLSICSNGITVVTLQDSKVYTREILDSDFGSLLIALSFLARAHDESHVKSIRLRERWKNKRDTIAEKPLTGKLPGWLCLNDSKQIDVIPERAEIVKELFDQYVSGASPRTIANNLNEDAVEPWGLGRQKAEKWHSSYIQKILDSEAVIGTFTTHKIEFEGIKKKRVPVKTIAGYFPAVVDAGTFNRVQEVRSRNKLKGRKSTGGLTNAFSMVLRCPVCGSFVIRVNKNSKTPWQYLVCGAAKSGLRDAEKGYRLCPGGYNAIRYDKVEKAFVSAVLAGQLVPTSGSALAAIEAAIAEKQQLRASMLEKLNNLVRSLLDGALTGDTPMLFDVPRPDGTIANWTVREERELLEGGIKGAEADIERLQVDRDALKPKAIEAKLEELKRAVAREELDRDQVNILLLALCDRAELNTARREMVFNLRHSDKPVVIGWED